MHYSQMWNIILIRPGHPNMVVGLDNFWGTTIERVVEYRETEFPKEWQALNAYIPRLYIQRFNVFWVCPKREVAVASYGGVRRSYFIARHFDPKRIPD